ncbi:hypothetical protein [Mycobacterium sp. M26]|nr:hypothetical protein [Mycobacterium sp. M26]
MERSELFSQPAESTEVVYDTDSGPVHYPVFSDRPAPNTTL